MKTKNPELDKLNELGITTGLFMENADVHAVFFYMGQDVKQVRLGEISRPEKEDIEEWVKMEGTEKVLEDTKLMRMFALSDYIQDESDKLVKAAQDEFYRNTDREDIEENWPEESALIAPSVREIYPLYDLDKLIDKVPDAKAVEQYAVEHGRIESGYGHMSQKLHAETGTGANIIKWPQRIEEATRARAEAQEAEKAAQEAAKTPEQVKAERRAELEAEFLQPEPTKPKAEKAEELSDDRKEILAMLGESGKSGGKYISKGHKGLMKVDEFAEAYMEEGRAL
ncbi:MAG: hypothetical protein IAE94_05290 [Chthoniobacterales bacterium]|nr:hypothetical protein [Chthoniobacterales bacterium]